MSSHRYLISFHSPKNRFFVARYRCPFLARTVYPGSGGYDDIRNGRNMWSIIIGPFHPSTINPLLSHARQSLYKHDPLLFLLPRFARHQQRLSLHRAFHNAAPILPPFFFPFHTSEWKYEMRKFDHLSSTEVCRFFRATNKRKD